MKMKFSVKSVKAVTSQQQHFYTWKDEKKEEERWWCSKRKRRNTNNSSRETREKEIHYMWNRADCSLHEQDPVFRFLHLFAKPYATTKCQQRTITVSIHAESTQTLTTIHSVIRCKHSNFRLPVLQILKLITLFKILIISSLSFML